MTHVDNLKDFLAKRYDSDIVVKIIQWFAFPTLMRFHNYLDKINKFLVTE